MGAPEAGSAPEGQGGNVVPFRPQPESLPEGAGLWDRARARLQAEAPALFDAWLRPLIETGRAGGRLELAAPSRFHASYVSTHLMSQLVRAVRLEDATIRTISVIVP